VSPVVPAESQWVPVATIRATGTLSGGVAKRQGNPTGAEWTRAREQVERQQASRGVVLGPPP